MRDAVDAAVERLLAGAVQGRGGAVVVRGGVGSGRTTVLDDAAAAAAARGMQVLRATAAPAETGFDHGVTHQLVDPLLLGARGWHLAAPPTGLLPGRDPAVEYGAGARDRTLWRFVEALAGRVPLAVLVDDLQWSDPASLRWLTRLADRSAGQPIALVGTVLAGQATTGGPADDGALLRALLAVCGSVHLHPLDVPATTALVRERCGPGATSAFLDAVGDVCHGVPSVLHAVLDEVRGLRPDDDAVAAVRAARPSALRERLRRAARLLPDPARTYLQAVAVLDGAGPGSPADRLSGLDPVDRAAAVARLVGDGLLVGDPPRVLHPLLGEVAADPDGWEDLHLRAARLRLELGHGSEEIAAHLLAVAAPLQRWGIEILRAAAHRAATLDPGSSRAVRYLRRALLDDDSTGRDRGALLVELAAAEYTEESSTAVRHVGQAVRLLDSPRDRARALAVLDPALLRDAPEPLRAAVRDLAAASPPGLPTAHDAQALDDDDARELRLRILTRSLRLDEDEPGGTDAVAGMLDEALASADPLLSTAAGRELLAVVLHGAAEAGTGSAAAVAHVASRVLKVASPQELRSPAGVAAGDGHRGLLITALVAAGRAAALTVWLAERPGADPRDRAEAELVRLACGVPSEQPAAARPYPDGRPVAFTIALACTAASAGARLDDRDPDRAGLAAHIRRRLVRATAALAEDAPALALECVWDAGRHLDHLGWCNPALFPWRGWAAELLAGRGDRAAALRLLDEELERALAWGAPGPVQRARRLRDRVLGTGTDDSAGHDRPGTGLSPVAPVPPPPVLPAEQTRPDPAASTRARTADPAGTAGSGVAGADRLTAAELRVVELAAAGDGNQQIAARLGLSRRAVEKRLTSAYRRLGISGRAELRPRG
ncbi:Adenylate cyclase [Pseudonocardia sp. Ae406_Ps2]|uniref:AAA family ATPase n=1 Tax=unclassified Pseudonocardia TaxID=2619320 RepID=UPI000965DF67|nr:MULTISPECIES: LuxR family transcriptional regulator [unclassified Pseudonocardia]OLM01456.1 Adenylate cyclase [Pseudonocardia sp. Ae406_Ps2]OLM06743.1 Adenylate cyclase [Pseudonocardia sp. Ae331_Ps2]OLM14963.1 Adenylate cyclase [Pseudonocardia sp. Ae505_Ps2]OLM23027.1 Adenylate cyclase [Pseudonocardia sp. Ae706_Ps2]